MKPKIAFVLLALGLATASWGQDAQKRQVPPECTKIIRVHGSFPKWKGTVKFLPKESYKRPPIIKYQVQEDGTVSNVAVTRSSGVADIDKKLRDAIARWEYKPRPVGCGTIETEMVVTIDWF
jgi:TonB family protein